MIFGGYEAVSICFVQQWLSLYPFIMTGNREREAIVGIDQHTI